MSRTALGAVLMALVGWIVVDCAPARAHELGVVRVRLVENRPAHYVLDIRLPLVLQFATQLPSLPTRCRVSTTPDVQARHAWIDLRVAFDCAGARLTEADVIQLPWPNHGAFVSAELRGVSTDGRFFAASENGATMTLNTLSAGQDRTWVEISRRYLVLGIEHILAGWDHLAFVLMLCLLASGWHLLRLVSAFTVGHSATLALASAGFVYMPAAPVEAAIALSVVFLAREVLRGGEHTLSHGAVLVFGFGLLHGLGFASALGANGIARAEFYLGLATFNLGVEIGQLMFVAVVVGLTFLGRATLAERARRVIYATSAYAVGILGAYWTLQRTL